MLKFIGKPIYGVNKNNMYEKLTAKEIKRNKEDLKNI